MRKNVLVSSLLCLALAMGVTASAGENWVGTWKVNTSKSTAGTSGLRVDTLKFEATPEGIKLTSARYRRAGQGDSRQLHVEVRRQGSGLDRQPAGRHGRAEEGRRQQLREQLEAGWKGHRRGEGRRVRRRQDPDGHAGRHRFAGWAGALRHRVRPPVGGQPFPVPRRSARGAVRPLGSRCPLECTSTQVPASGGLFGRPGWHPPPIRMVD